MPEWFYQIGLFLCSPECYILMTCLGLVSPKYRHVVYWGVLGCILSAMVNYNLKLWLQIPLSLGRPGYAFPSGHMQAAGFIYSWLALHRVAKLNYLLLPLLAWIGASILHFGYHNLFDLIGGLSCAWILVAFYQRIYQQQNTLFLFSLELLILNFSLYFLQQGLDFKIISTSLIFLTALALQTQFPFLAPQYKNQK